MLWIVRDGNSIEAVAWKIARFANLRGRDSAPSVLAYFTEVVERPLQHAASGSHLSQTLRVREAGPAAGSRSPLTELTESPGFPYVRPTTCATPSGAISFARSFAFHDSYTTSPIK